jgi:hypothetical protein
MNGEWRGMEMMRRAAAALGFCVAAVAGVALPASGQGLADYDYDQLSFRGVGFDVGYIFPDRVEDAVQYGLRVDLGYLGPGVRIIPRFAYFSSTMTGPEVNTLEERVADLVFQQNPLSPRPQVDLGEITWAALSAGLDAQLVWRVKFGFLTYLGGGVAAHFQNGSGASIDGTFVEDLLDSTVAGANVHAGFEVPLGSLVRLYGDARYEFMGDLRFPAVRAGLQFMTGRRAPGELN